MAKTPKQLVRRKHSKLKFLYIALLVLLIGFGGFFFVRYMQVESKYKDAILTQDQKNQQTLAKIGKLMDLPKDEKPTDIIVIKDKDKLNSPATTKAFYAKVENNDILVAYQKANISMIYRPSDNRIIKTDNYSNFYAATYPVNVAIIAPQDKQSDIEKAITQKVLNINVVSKQVPKSNNTQSMVVDVSGTNAKAAKELADKLGLTVGQLPLGESKPEGATLVVLITSTTTAP